MAQVRVVTIDQRYLDAANEFLSGASGAVNPKQAQTLLDMYTDFEVNAHLDDTPEKYVALLGRACLVGNRIGLTFAETCAVLSFIFEHAKSHPNTIVDFGTPS